MMSNELLQECTKPKLASTSCAKPVCGASSLLAPNEYEADEHLDDKQLLKREFAAVGFRVRLLGPFVIATNEHGSCWAMKGDTSFQSATAAKLFKQKMLTNRLLRRAGISTTEGKAYRKVDAAKARDLVRQFGRAVIKPTDGAEGRGVSVNVDEWTFGPAWEHAWATGARRVLVEKFVGGQEARFFVLDGCCAAVVHRIPPQVIGNGTCSIAELVEKRNKARAGNPHLKRKPFILDEQKLLLLKTRGLNEQYVPLKGERIVLDLKGNLSAGAESEDATESVHDDYKRIAEQISETVVGCHAIGVDIIADDLSKPATPGNYTVIEANTYPNLLGHYFPMYGTRRNVYRMIAESCLSRMQRQALAEAFTKRWLDSRSARSRERELGAAAA